MFKAMRFDEITKVVREREREGKERGPWVPSTRSTFPLGPKMAAEFQPLCLLSMQEEGGRAKCSCLLI